MRAFQYSPDVTERLARATVLSPLWEEFDRGAMDEEALLDKFIENDPGLEKEIRRVRENIHDMLGRYDYAIPWLQDLKGKGYKVYYLSNFSRKAHQECAHVLDFLPLMDGGILSYQEKLIKPDPAIYQLLLRRYGLKAEECVFWMTRRKMWRKLSGRGWRGSYFTAGNWRWRNCAGWGWRHSRRIKCLCFCRIASIIGIL